MKHNIIFLGSLLVLVALTVGAPAAAEKTMREVQLSENPESIQKLKNSLEVLLIRELKKERAVPGAAIYLNAPRLGLYYGAAAGLSDKKTRKRLLPQQPIRFGGNTKTFIAAAILRLWEDGKLELDLPITNYISRYTASILQSGGYEPYRITIRQLLTHTSGINYSDSGYLAKTIRENPMRRWQRDDLLIGAVKWGKPVGSPGETFHYSDTGYVLLGEILEQVTGTNMGEAVRELDKFAELGIDNTWWEVLESEPAFSQGRAHQYSDNADSYSWDPSSDLYGGGGLIGSVEDLSTFMQALFTGKIFRLRGTEALMLTGIDNIAGNTESRKITKRRKGYGMGIRLRKIANMLSYEHSGSWGTSAAYFPELDVSIAVVSTQRKSNTAQRILSRAAKLLRKETVGRIFR